MVLIGPYAVWVIYNQNMIYLMAYVERIVTDYLFIRTHCPSCDPLDDNYGSVMIYMLISLPLEYILYAIYEDFSLM